MSNRLPIPGSDNGTWGDILNAFLEVSHNGDGTLATSALQQAGGVTSVNGQTPSSGAVSLTAANVSALPTSTPLSGLADTSGVSGATDGQVLSYSAATSQWVASTAATTVSDASTSNKGVVQLSGDLSGTAALPTVAATSLTAPLPVNQGGTGSITQNFVDLSSDQTIAGNKIFSGSLSSTDLQITGGTPATGKVLTSDTSGNATWQTPSGGGNGTLAGDSDVSITSPATGQVLTYNGSAWANIPASRAALAVVYSADCPASLKGVADSTFTYQCTGTNDDVIINQAITQVAATGQSYTGNGTSGGTGSPPSGGGGTVLLMGYTFNLYAPIVMKSWVSLIGGFDRAATSLIANAAFSGSQMIGVQFAWTERTVLRNFRLIGNKAGGVTSNGIYYYGQIDQVPYSHNDPTHTIENLFIEAVGNNGLYLDSATRATVVNTVRIFQAANYGFYIACPDSWFNNSDSGGSGAEGWYISGANCNYENIKSWYSHTNDYTIAGTRNQFANCLAQDAYQHGWNIISGKNTMVGCMSDSAGLNTTGYGINIGSVSYVTIRGHQSFDRNTTPHQIYGVYFANKLTNAYSSIDVVTYNNVTGSYYDNSGVNTADPTSLISIRGT